MSRWRFKAVKKIKNLIILIFAILAVSVIVILHNFNSSNVSLPWYVSSTNIEKFWDNGNTGTIALIDSGYNHELDDQVYNEQIVAEYNCFDLSTNVTDETGHGSNMVLLLIGKHKKNNIIGIAPKSQIVVLKVTNETGSATEEAMICAIEKAIELKCDIINISMGTNKYSSKVENSIKKALDKEILVLASVGDDEEEDFLYPSNLDGVLSVAAQRKDGRISQFSNYSYNKDAVLFPGVDIDVLSKNVNNDYETVKNSGSSIATVLLSGCLSIFVKEIESADLTDFVMNFDEKIINFSKLEDV